MYLSQDLFVLLMDVLCCVHRHISVGSRPKQSGDGDLVVGEHHHDAT